MFSTQHYPLHLFYPAAYRGKSCNNCLFTFDTMYFGKHTTFKHPLGKQDDAYQPLSGTDAIDPLATHPRPPFQGHGKSIWWSILAKPVAGYTLKTTLADELTQRSKGVVQPRAAISAPAAVTVPADFRILVAEDNSISTKVIRGMLGKLNLNPDTASNGEEALEAMKAQRYDLVLMDCEMPILDGFSATQQLRAWEVSHQRIRTPVVALTAHILSEHKERARQAGMDGHMAKPVELSQLRELVEFWVAQRQQRPEHAPS